MNTTPTRVTHHLFQLDDVVFFDGGQISGTAKLGTVVAHHRDEVIISGVDGLRYYIDRGDVVLR